MAIAYDPEADHYVALGIQGTATTEDIKKAHRARIRDLHPDRGGDATRATAVNIARAVLLDPAKRREYDQARHDWIMEASKGPFLRAFAGAARAASEQHAHATPHTSAAESHQGTTAASAASSASSASSYQNPASAERQARAWRWGITAENAWDDVRKIFKSGDWLGAAGLLGTALLVDHAIQQSADPEQLAKYDAALAAKRRERAMEFIESAASAIGAHFGLDGSEAAARVSTAARNAAPTTTRGASRRRGARKRNGAPGVGAARTRSR